MSTPANLQHRIGSRRVRVIGRDGQPAAFREVTVSQTDHAIAFGNIGFDFVGTPEDPEASGIRTSAMATDFLDLFNTATLPFYWERFEPVRGEPQTAALRSTAEWFAANGVALKGHPLVWHTLTAPWLLTADVDEIEREQRARIRRDVGDFAGLIDTWDAINEVVIMPVFTNGDNGITRLCLERGRIATIRMAFEEARAANPSATLLLNDFDLSSAYECLIEGVLEAGIRIDALGLQTHMHQGYWGEDRMLAMIDRFARYGLPLHLTETTLLSGDLMPPHIEDLNDYQVASWPSTEEGEARQADEMVRHYRSSISHPAISAITYWGFTDRDAWLGAPVGLVRSDGSRKPSYDALRALIKDEWWQAPAVRRTDADGFLEVGGFNGTYAVDADGSSVSVEVDGVDATPLDVVLGS